MVLLQSRSHKVGVYLEIAARGNGLSMRVTFLAFRENSALYGNRVIQKLLVYDLISAFFIGDIAFFESEATYGWNVGHSPPFSGSLHLLPLRPTVKYDREITRIDRTIQKFCARRN